MFRGEVHKFPFLARTDEYVPPRDVGETHGRGNRGVWGSGSRFGPRLHHQTPTKIRTE